MLESVGELLSFFVFNIIGPNTPGDNKCSIDDKNAEKIQWNMGTIFLLDIWNASLSDKNTTYTPCIKKTANDSRKIKREI